jgi:FtsP/CotA-like multicopper oxidase with cupredoxin domain
LQVVVESSSSALEYGDLPVDQDSPVNPDLHFDSQLMHLYVMTDKKVSIGTTPYQVQATLPFVARDEGDVRQRCLIKTTRTAWNVAAKKYVHVYSSGAV